VYDDIVVGGAGFIGSAIARVHAERGGRVLVVDRRDEASVRASGCLPDAVAYEQVNLLTDDLALPDGRVVLAHGISQPRVPHPWELAQANAWTTARMLRSLQGREVVLLSTVEVYGTAPGMITSKTKPMLPMGSAEIRRWCDRTLSLVDAGAGSSQVAQHCRTLVDADPSARWAYALSKRAQELLLMDAWEIPHLRVLRVSNVFGAGQERVVERLTRRMMAGLSATVTDAHRTFVHVDDVARVAVAGQGSGVVNAGTGVLRLPEVVDLVAETLGVQRVAAVTAADDDGGSGLIDTVDFNRLIRNTDPQRLRKQLAEFVEHVRREPATPLLAPIPVVRPPKPEQPHVVADAIAGALSSGVIKGGGPMSQLLQRELRSVLQLDDDRELLLTSSGSAALRLAIVAAAGPSEPGDVALMPSFTFAATAETASQLGYRLQFCDVDADTWTLDPQCVAEALAASPVKVVIAVDTLGNPANYAELTRVCADAGVPLVADSAPALGSYTAGRPVGCQAEVHAFSMSFAKTVSAGGAGGFLTLPRDWMGRLTAPVDWTRSAMLGEIHAAVALDQVQHLDRIRARRDAIAAIYADLATASAAVTPQVVAEGDRHSWVHWTAAFDVDDVSLLGKELEALGVQTKPYYSPALHHVDWGDGAVGTCELPVTEALAQRVLALPMSSEMTTADADAVLWRVLGALA
jgi:dTDP-4-amino-4,6-dideoxygalactose transaminase/nucleoside-diphosphate-sugar epimerase